MKITRKVKLIWKIYGEKFFDDEKWLNLNGNLIDKMEFYLTLKHKILTQFGSFWIFFLLFYGSKRKVFSSFRKYFYEKDLKIFPVV